MYAGLVCAWPLNRMPFDRIFWPCSHLRHTTLCKKKYLNKSGETGRQEKQVKRSVHLCRNFRVPALYLYSSLGQRQFVAEFLAHERVRVMRLVKQSLELVELFHREVGSTASLLQLLLQNAASAALWRHLTAAAGNVTLGAILDAILDVQVRPLPVVTAAGRADVRVSVVDGRRCCNNWERSLQ